MNLCLKCQREDEVVASEECLEVFARLQEKGIDISMDTIKRYNVDVILIAFNCSHSFQDDQVTGVARIFQRGGGGGGHTE